MNTASDNSSDAVLSRLLKGLEGRCYAEKVYLSKLFEEVYQQGLQLVTKIRKNMVNVLMDLDDKIRLKRRAGRPLPFNRINE